MANDVVCLLFVVEDCSIVIFCHLTSVCYCVIFNSPMLSHHYILVTLHCYTDTHC